LFMGSYGGLRQGNRRENQYRTIKYDTLPSLRTTVARINYRERRVIAELNYNLTKDHFAY